MKSSKQHFNSFRTDYKPGSTLDPRGYEANRPDRSGDVDRDSAFADYRQWLWPYRFPLLMVFILAVFSDGLAMVIPFGTRHIIDDVLLSGSYQKSEGISWLAKIGGGMLALLVIAGLVDTFRRYRMAVLNARVVFRLREKLYNKLLRLPLSEIGRLKSGGIVSRLSTDVDNVTGLVQMAVISPGVAFIRIVLIVVALFIISWQLSLAAVAMLPPLLYVSIIWVRKIRPMYRSTAADRTIVDGRVAETFGGIRVVRTFAREKKEQLDYSVGHHTMIRKKLFANILELVVDASWNFLIPVTSLVIVWAGGTLYFYGQGSVGDIVAFQMYSIMLLQPVWRIVYSISQIQRALASMDRVFALLRQSSEMPDRPGASEAPATVQAIELENISFSYTKDKPVIKQLSARIPSGSLVALVGPSGAGKTTLTDLLARFYDVAEGSIRVNETDIRDYTLGSYRSLLGIVQQDVFLFDGTVAENIAYGRKAANRSEIEEAAHKANAHEFILDLPDDYDTIIGERGFRLSGGQRQRLSIARAVLADPQILILDEATSQLDTESEQLIQHALSDLFRQRTTFVIAHRLSTVTTADLILVMKDGELIEVGNHQSLIGSRGVYFEMVEKQRNSFAPHVDFAEV